ncbi:MAG: adenosylhomocysteinase [Candidatus Latescibacteria bacterium]|nr:adenosylhomocysteinase [bacterium]MBD3424554.1 adenosylhomocysteinase [Candidatus Latescibacterota bacterium]
MNYDCKDEGLAPRGKKRIEWADSNMPVLRLIRERFEREKPLDGIRVAACLHVTTETANLMRTLKAGGAETALCASNPLSTQDDVAASLIKDYGISVFAVRGEDNKLYYEHINSVLDIEPHITMDDGADLVSTLHKSRRELIDKVIGGSEETTTGVIRLRSMESNGVLAYPIVAVNDAETKHFFDNRYGTGQSTVDGIIRSTNMLMAGKRVVVFGYGWCGRGFAMRARGMGAIVTVVEVDPVRALEALMDGYNVAPSSRAAEFGDLFVTLTGDISVIRKEHFQNMKDGAVIANSGHFNVEIDIPDLEEMADSRETVRDNLVRYTMPDGRKLILLGEGRLINLAGAEGHPASVMDMSFANQSLTAEYLTKERGNLEKKVYRVPESIDRNIAELKLDSLGVEIEELTEKQKEYLASWQMGT